MIERIKTLIGIGLKLDFRNLVKNGAIIIDVRTREEFQNGHISKSHNLPLSLMLEQIGTLDKQKTFITCSASGLKSAQAKSILKSEGFKKVYNGGGWQSLNYKIR